MTRSGRNIPITQPLTAAPKRPNEEPAIPAFAFNYDPTNAKKVHRQTDGIVCVEAEDYDAVDRLHFDPLHVEDVLEICDAERPLGIVVQLGGQTPLKLAVALEKAGVPILGTSPDAIDRAEDRERFDDLLDRVTDNVLIPWINRLKTVCPRATGIGGSDAAASLPIVPTIVACV